MRRVARFALAVAAACACAQPGAPPGGPPDLAPPAIVRVTPDSNSVNVRAGAVTFVFDEVISERPRSAPSLAELFVISPSVGTPEISWRRTRVAVSPPGGFRPNTTYSVELRPGLTDLSNNADTVGHRITFSTGAAIASGFMAGRIFDWAAARPAPEALMEAIALPDSARYAARADSAGLFALRNMPPGRYLLRAVVDANRNGALDERELFDSVTVELQDSLRREMLAALRDSLGPSLSGVDARDSLQLRITLDRPLDTAFIATPAAFSLRTEDSATVAIDTVLTQADVDRAAADSARQRAVQDSLRAVAVADSIRQADTTARAQPPTRPTGRRPGAPAATPAAAPRQTPPPPIPTPSAAIPVSTLYLRVASPLAPGATFRLSADSLRGVSGVTRSSTRVFSTTAARPDTGASRPDTGAVRRDTVDAVPRGRRRD
ncbi:MAG TPA: Ig-like domain-containing protein [Gemmatimonadaceae bacterium]|nr:Ig-like domain-containing protein [Gemmatimonadaceae bacterium]